MDRKIVAPVAIALALMAATWLVFGQLRHYGFTNFDDDAYVSGNVHVRDGFTRAGIIWAFSSFDFFYWQPLTWLSHMLDCQWFGLQAGWHHVTNVILHALNSILVFLILRRMTGSIWRSAMVAGLFAIHPLRVESVAWIAERKDVLSCFWFLLTLGAYVRYTERPSNGRYGLVLLGMLLGLMSKPMLVTVPILFLLVDYWPLRRVAIAEKLPMAILAVVAAVLTWVGQSRMGAMVWSAGIPLKLRLCNALVSYVRYLGKAIWPENLAILYPYPASYPGWQVGGAVVLLGAISAVVLWAGRRQRYLAFGWFWFVIGLWPTIGLVQVGRQAMADRFSYIPLLGLFIAAVWGAAVLLGDHRKLAAITAGVVLLACGIRSWAQAGTWRDSITVFEHAIAVTPANSLAHRHLAAALEKQGKLADAIPHYSEAVRIEPSYFLAQHDLGTALLATGHPEAAAIHLAAAIHYFPDYPDACYQLGKALIVLGKSTEAIAPLESALRLGLKPEDEAGAKTILAGLVVSKK